MEGMKFIGGGLMLVISHSLCAQANPPFKQDGSGPVVEEIVVTAQRREELLQDAPLSISAFDGQTLMERNVFNVSDLKVLVPGFSAEPSLGVTLPFLRGIGNPALIVGNEASAPVYVDGVYHARISPSFLEFNNIERVEVLKGPQGTLFGRNSTGGLVHIITREPSAGLVFDGSLELSEYETTRVSGYVSGGGRGWAADIATLFKEQRQGWGENLTTGDETYTDENVAVRAKLVLAPSEGSRITISGDFNDSSSGQGLAQHAFRGERQGDLMNLGAALPEIGFYDSRGDLHAYADVEAWGGALTWVQQLGIGELTSITSHREMDGRIDIDADFQPVEYFHAFEPYESRQTSQEIRLASTDAGSIDWIGGLYYLRQMNAYVPTRLFGDSFGPGVILDLFGKQKSEAYSAFGQATLHLESGTSLTAGIRYTFDDLEAAGHMAVLLADGGTIDPGSRSRSSEEFDRVTWRLAVDHQFSTDLMAFASVSEGYKSGVFNLQPFSGVPVDPEVLRAYEIGFKSRLLGRRMRLNGSAFYYDIQDPQVQRDTGSGVSLQNAGSAEVYGVEIDSALVIGPDLSIHLGATWLAEAEYRDFRDALFYIPNPNPPFGNLPEVVVGDASGNRMPRAPEVSFSLGANYERHTAYGSFEANINFARASAQYFNPDNLQREPAYGLLDAQIRYAPLESGFSITVFGKNLTAEKYFGSVLQTAGPVGNVGAPGAPRTVGVRVAYESL